MEYLGTEKPINKIQPVVSVCIATYNHVSYIAECLDSVLMQVTNFPFEIIVGEDDSSDGTREICKLYAEKYPDKIRLFLREDKDKILINGKKSGRANNINNFNAARGKYIALCEGDDFWIDKYKMMKQVAILDKEKDIALVHSDVRGLKGDEYIEEVPYKRWNTLKPRATFYDALSKPIAFTCTVMFRNLSGGEILKDSNQVISGDWVMWVNILRNGDALYLSEKLAVYRIGVGISNILDFKKIKNFKINYLRQELRSARFSINKKLGIISFLLLNNEKLNLSIGFRKLKKRFSKLGISF